LGIRSRQGTGGRRRQHLQDPQRHGLTRDGDGGPAALAAVLTADGDRVMPEPVFQLRLPFAPWMDAMANRLPGLQPVAPGEWLLRDDAFSGQMAERDHQIAINLSRVRCSRPAGDPEILAAERELLTCVLEHLRHDPAYTQTASGIARPDGVTIAPDGDPVVTASRLVQEDLLILRPEIDGHMFASALVTFPASWTLSEKIGRPLAAIHGTVERYTEALAARVENVLQHLRPEAPLWRANYLLYNNPALYQPRRESERRPFDASGPIFVRVERQTLLRLPVTGAVVFSIHTSVVPRSALTPDQRDALFSPANAGVLGGRG